MSLDIWNFLGILQSHNSYSNCGLGSHGTDRLVALVKQKIQKSERDSRTLFGAKITGGGCGGTVCILGRAGIESNNQISEVRDKYSCFQIFHFTAPLQVYSFMISEFFRHQSHPLALFLDMTFGQSCLFCVQYLPSSISFWCMLGSDVKVWTNVHWGSNSISPKFEFGL